VCCCDTGAVWRWVGVTQHTQGSGVTQTATLESWEQQHQAGLCNSHAGFRPSGRCFLALWTAAALKAAAVGCCGDRPALCAHVAGGRMRCSGCCVVTRCGENSRRGWPGGCVPDSGVGWCDPPVYAAAAVMHRPALGYVDARTAQQCIGCPCVVFRVPRVCVGGERIRVLSGTTALVNFVLACNLLSPSFSFLNASLISVCQTSRGAGQLPGLQLVHASMCCCRCIRNSHAASPLQDRRTRHATATSLSHTIITSHIQ
jgi:hypothetical protein